MAIQEKSAPAEKKHIRHGIGSVRPYLYGHLDLLEFVRQAFGAAELERLKVGANGFHVEAKIGDSMIVMEAGEPPPPSGTRASTMSMSRTWARPMRAQSRPARLPLLSRPTSPTTSAAPA
jgi:hypothetical protein